MLALLILALTLSTHAQLCPAIPVASCTGLNASKCPLSYYNPGASLYYTKFPCVFSGSTCSASASQCISYCPGTTQSTSRTCTGVPVATCESYYTSIGFLWRQCDYLPSSNTCGQTSPATSCIATASSVCSGTTVTAGCSSLTTQAACTNRYQIGAHGAKAQCAWTTGVGCYSNVPCR